MSVPVNVWKPRTLRERVRYHVGYWLAEPFYRLGRLGERSMNVCARLSKWAERPGTNGGQP